MIDDIRSRKLRRILCFLVPFVYAAVMLQSVADKLFPADDPGELGFVRIRSLPQLLCGYDVFGLFRPVKNALWLVFSALEPFGVEWCHVFSIVVGILSFFPVLALCRRVSGNEWKALAAASIWLLSPTLVSCAAWLSCLNIQVMVAFAALAIVLHDKAWNGGSFRPLRIAAACVFFFLALLSYECAVSVAPILLAFDWILRPGRLARTSGRFVETSLPFSPQPGSPSGGDAPTARPQCGHRAWISHLCYWIVVLSYLLLRHFAGAVGQAGGRWIEATRGQLIVTSPWFAVQHVASWFWPFGRFSVGGSYVWGEVPVAILVLCAVAGVAVLALAWAIRIRRPVLSFSILFSVLGLVPVCNFLGFGNGPYGDYYLTLASIGLATGCIEIAWWLSEANGRWRLPARIVLTAFALVRIVAVPEAARWAHLWTSDDLAYAEAARNFPDSLQNLCGSIFPLMAEERWEDVINAGRRIEQMVGPDSPRMAGVYYSRYAFALSVTKDRKTATEMLDRFATVTDPDETGKLVLFHRGCICEDLDGDKETAEDYFKRALDGPLDIGLVPCADRLARLKVLRGEQGEAIALWERARTLSPDNVSVLWNLAIAYRDSGQPEKSAEMLERVRVLTGNPDLGKSWSSK